MGVALWGASAVLENALNMAGLRYLALAGLVAFGMFVYFGTGQLIGAFRLSDLRKSMHRG